MFFLVTDIICSYLLLSEPAISCRSHPHECLNINGLLNLIVVFLMSLLPSSMSNIILAPSFPIRKSTLSSAVTLPRSLVQFLGEGSYSIKKLIKIRKKITPIISKNNILEFISFIFTIYVIIKLINKKDVKDYHS